MFFLSRRSKIFWAFVGLAITLLVAFSSILYVQTERAWNTEKRQWLNLLIEDIVSVEQAEQYFADLRVISPYGKILMNAGIFELLPDNVLWEDHELEYRWLKLYIIEKELPNGLRILFADDITDAVESRNLMFRNFFTTMLILLTAVLGVGWIFTRSIFQPVNRIVSAIEGFSLEQDPKRDLIPIGWPVNDEFVRIARNLESLFQRIRTETRRIEDLSSNVAHEMKNSLFGIATTLELAMLSNSPEQKLKSAHAQVLHLGEIVRTLLLLANKETSVERHDTPLFPILERIKGDDSRITIAGNPEVSWSIHSELCEVAIGNIVGNARKFTPKNGHITLRFDETHLEVEDTWIGIPEDKLPYVFDRFFKTDEARTNGSGTGLWLALSKHILEQLHGMRISIKSQVGIGTTLRIDRLSEIPTTTNPKDE